MKVDLPSIKNRENANTHSIKVNIYSEKQKIRKMNICICNFHRKKNVITLQS